MLKNYIELKVWQTSCRHCLDLNRITKNYPKEERYGRKTIANDLRSLSVADGSVCELAPRVLLSGDLHYVTTENLKDLNDDAAEVERMLKALIKS